MKVVSTIIDTSLQCWICGSHATTREHKIKRSDLKALFAAPSQQRPIMLHTEHLRNIPVGSLDSHKLKSPVKICEHCNSARTQEHDRAWETLSERLRSLRPAEVGEGYIKGYRVFPYDTSKMLGCMQLYFVKQFGLHALESRMPINVGSFAEAIMTGVPHKDIYLQFFILTRAESLWLGGMTDIETIIDKVTGQCAFAVWIYYVGHIGVQVTYIAEAYRKIDLRKHWSPRSGSTRIPVFCESP